MKNSFFDFLMPVLRNKFVWFPFYAFIISFVLFNFPIRRASLFIFGLVFTVVCTDFVSGQLIKNKVKRLRPCREVLIQNKVEVMVECGSGYSFPSSHAANHFGMAFFMTFAMGGLDNKFKAGLLLWAAMISLAQIYVGLHYPLDIFGGIIIAYMAARLMSTIVFRI